MSNAQQPRLEPLGNEEVLVTTDDYGRAVIWLRENDWPYCWHCSSETCEHIQAYWEGDDE